MLRQFFSLGAPEMGPPNQDRLLSPLEGAGFSRLCLLIQRNGFSHRAQSRRKKSALHLEVEHGHALSIISEKWLPVFGEI
jgi:hypothetical protein